MNIIDRDILDPKKKRKKIEKKVKRLRLSIPDPLSKYRGPLDPGPQS